MTGRSELAPAPRSRFALPKASLGVLTPDERSRALTFVRDLLTSPTAPYFEDGPSRVVRAFVAERAGLELRVDAHANLIVTWPGAAPASGARDASSARTRSARGSSRRAGAGRPSPSRGTVAPTLAFSAHLDHPGFHALGVRKGVHRAAFHGGVPARFMPGSRVRFHDPRDGSACATAVVATAAVQGDDGIVAELADVRGRIGRGSFGVFDLPDGVVRGTRLHARVCDDLMGAASILCTLDHVWRTSTESPLIGVFTRAEETGFVGCLGLLESKSLPRDTWVVGLECSPKRSTALVGHGPVLRVGDRQSVFDPEITLELDEAMTRVAARVPEFRRQRALMDGGSCESTAYNHYGVRAGAMCLALGNYHNCGPAQTIAPEYVDWNDFEGLVATMIECTRGFGAGAASGKMRTRLQRIWQREYKRLEDSSARLRAEPSGGRTRRPPHG